MTIVAALYREARSAERHEVALDGTLRNPDRRPFDVVVGELSCTGFRAPAATRLDVGATISLGLPGVGMCSARVVRRTGRGYGCEFVPPLRPDQLDEAMRATAARPVVLSALADGFLFEPTADEVSDQPISGLLRTLTIIAIAAASWAGLLAGRNLFAG